MVIGCNRLWRIWLADHRIGWNNQWLVWPVDLIMHLMKESTPLRQIRGLNDNMSFQESAHSHFKNTQKKCKRVIQAQWILKKGAY